MAYGSPISLWKVPLDTPLEPLEPLEPPLPSRGGHGVMRQKLDGQDRALKFKAQMWEN